MCMLRAGLVKNCRRCKSSVRLNCVYRKKIRQKTFSDNKKKGEKAAQFPFRKERMNRGEKMSQRTLHEAKCTTCNQTAMVPFKPTPGKPVYCKTCFAKRSTLQPVGTSTNHNFEPKQAWARRRQSPTFIPYLYFYSRFHSHKFMHQSLKFLKGVSCFACPFKMGD